MGGKNRASVSGFGPYVKILIYFAASRREHPPPALKGRDRPHETPEDPMLEERLNDAMKQALKAGNPERLGTLRMMRSQVLLEKKKDASIQVLSDPQVIQVLGSYAKKLRDASAEYEKLGRPEEAAKIRSELAVVQEFLPQPLTAEEAKALVQAVVADLGASSVKDFGRVMKEAQARAAGRADGKALSDLARAALDGR